MTAKQRVVIIPGDQPQEGIHSYGGKDYEKRKVLKREQTVRDTKFEYLKKNSAIELYVMHLYVIIIFVVIHNYISKLSMIRAGLVG